MVWISIPLILQKESRGMIVAAGNCGFWLSLIIGSTYAVRFLSGSQLVEPVQAAWIPIFFAAPLTVWMLDQVET
jgi:lipopolysaccharide export system permease protein